jgi:hypothetical protein
VKIVLEAGLEPAQPLWPRDFKSLVSTIPPFELQALQRYSILLTSANSPPGHQGNRIKIYQNLPCGMPQLEYIATIA